MNTHDIEQERQKFEAFMREKNPSHDLEHEFGIYRFSPVQRHWDTWQAAIEADRKRRTPPNEPFAIVVDRMYEGEGASLAYWNGENYQFSDGDCFDRDGDTLDGCTAEFLTDHQLEKSLFADRKRRGEPVAWRWKWKDLPDAGWQLSSVGGWRETDAIKSEPLYTTQESK